MTHRLEQTSARVAGPVAVVLWIVGVVVSQGTTTKLSDKATDPQILAWIKSNTNPVILGCWLFMIGCVAFVWFAGMLRSRLAAAEGGSQGLATAAFGGALAMGICGIATQSDLASAISKNDISPATAGALHHVGDLFFVGAELSFVVVLVAVAVLAFRTAVVPRWWAIVGCLVAAVLLVGPIGWAALIFGTPVWTLGTSYLLWRTPRRAPAPAPATVAA